MESRCWLEPFGASLLVPMTSPAFAARSSWDVAHSFRWSATFGISNR